jgi:hypothetical protein
MEETVANAIVFRERFPNYQALKGNILVETKGKDTILREMFPNYQALEGKENGRDQGKGYSRLRKVP